MNRKRALLTGTGVVLLAIAGALTWMIYLRPIAVEVVATERDVPVQVFGLGTVEARVTSKIGFKVAGVLVDLRADVGERVAKGAVLARLDDREQNARVARARAATEQTEANLQRATAGLEKAKANYANATSISERRQKLVQSNTASVETAETAKTAQDVAAAEVNLASSDILVARAAIGDAKAQRQQEAALLDFHVLTAPYDAVVITRAKELGSALGAGESVLTLIDPATVWTMAFIDESKAGDIAVGAPAEIVLRSRPAQRLGGRVARIEPESDRVNEERRIAIKFDAPPADLHLGEQAEVYITTMRLREALLVPEAAIAALAKGRGKVWTVEDGRLQLRDVSLGHRILDGRYEISGGLPDNAMVLARLRSGLRAGRTARIETGPGR